MMKQRHLVAQGQRRVLGIQSKASAYAGQTPSEQGTPVTPSIEGPSPAQQFVGTLTATEAEEIKPWLLAVTLGSTGNTDLAAGYLACDVVKIHDDDDSHELSFVWNEAETSANRTLNFLVHAGDRTLDLYENLKVVDGQNIELHASGGEKAQLAIDTQNAERTLDMSGNLTVEANSIINQDLSSDSVTATFAKLAITNAAVADDARALSSIATLVTNAKSDGIAAYFEGHIDGTTDGPTYGGGAWLNIDSGSTIVGDVRAWDIGIYESGADCSGGNAYGLAIHMEFDDTNGPAGIYPFRINCNDTANHATPDALIFAPNTSALGLVANSPGGGSADAYMKIKMQGGAVYRMPLITEGSSYDVTIPDGSSLNLQEDITFTGATTENQIKMPNNLLDALSIQEGSNKYVTFNTVNDEEDILFYKSVDILHTSTHADDHALEIDTDAAGYGDVKALDIDYITGNITAGEDEGILLLNIDRTLATGGDIFALEVLATDQVSGSTGIYGLKIGPEIGPVHHDSGTFENPTTSTDNAVDESDMRDGVLASTTTIFEADNEYIVIGAADAFQDMELVFSTPGNKSIKPTFHYSTGGTGFTAFTPVDGTDGCRHTGVISWDASDVPGHATNATGTFDIKIIRTKGGSFTTPVLGYAKTAATTEYIWDSDGFLTIAGLTATASIILMQQVFS